MESSSGPAALVVIVGETGSGKTALAVKLAKRFNGEIISADSRTVYKNMDIGTAKPTSQDQQGIKHHLLNIITPDQTFSAADFKRLAEAAISDIHARGKLPIIVGGTGLYIDSILYDFTFGPLPDMSERARLQMMSVDELQNILRQRSIDLPRNTQNPRHLIRAIETGGTIKTPHILRANTLILGLQVTREELTAKLQARVKAMIQTGLVSEVRHLVDKYGWSAPGLQATGYKAFRDYYENQATLSEAEAQFVRNDLHLAKRQRTWFKRNKSIHWISKQEQAIDLLTTFLNKK